MCIRCNKTGACLSEDPVVADELCIQCGGCEVGQALIEKAARGGQS